MQGILGETFKTAKGLASIEEVQSVGVVALYFCTNWCPPCRIFTPQLWAVYAEANQFEKRLEVVQISLDKDENNYAEYVPHTPWLLIPYKDPRILELKKKYRVTDVPQLLILNRDGSVACATGIQDIEKEGTAALEKWKSVIA